MQSQGKVDTRGQLCRPAVQGAALLASVVLAVALATPGPARLAAADAPTVTVPDGYRIFQGPFLVDGAVQLTAIDGTSRRLFVACDGKNYDCTDLKMTGPYVMNSVPVDLGTVELMQATCQGEQVQVIVSGVGLALETSPTGKALPELLEAAFDRNGRMIYYGARNGKEGIIRFYDKTYDVSAKAMDAQFWPAKLKMNSQGTRAAIALRTGTDTTVITAEGAGKQFSLVMDLEWTPNGEKLFYSATIGEGVNVSRFLVFGTQVIPFMPYMPDRHRYRVLPNGTLAYEQYEMDKQGRQHYSIMVGSTRLVDTAHAGVWRLAVSPDYRQMLLPERGQVDEKDYMPERTRYVLHGNRTGLYDRIGIVTISPDGHRLALCATNTKHFGNFDAGEVIANGETSQTWGQVSQLQWSPDSKQVIYTGQSNSDWMVVVGKTSYGPYRTQPNLKVDSQTGNLAFYGIANDGAHVISQGKDLDRFDAVFDFELTAEGKAFYCAMKAGQSGVYLDGKLVQNVTGRKVLLKSRLAVVWWPETPATANPVGIRGAFGRSAKVILADGTCIDWTRLDAVAENPRTGRLALAGLGADGKLQLTYAGKSQLLDGDQVLGCEFNASAGNLVVWLMKGRAIQAWQPQE